MNQPTISSESSHSDANWEHPMRHVSEVTIKTEYAHWKVGLDDENNLEVRLVNAPFKYQPEMTVRPESNNSITVKAILR